MGLRALQLWIERTKMPLARLPLTPWLRQARLLWCHERVDWRVEWCSVVFSDESRFCLYASNGHTRVQCRPGERYLPEWIRPRHISPTSGFMMWGGRGISYNLRSHLVFLQGKVKSAHYIAQVVNPVLLLFLRQEGVWFFSRTTHVHIRLLWCNVLFVVYNNCPGQQDSQISLTNWNVWNMMKQNLLFLRSLPQPLPNCDNWCKMLGRIYRKMIFGIFMTVCMWEYMPALPPEGVHCVLMWLFGHPLLWHVCFIWSEFIIYSYNDKLSVTSIFNTMNLSLKV